MWLKSKMDRLLIIAIIILAYPTIKVKSIKISFIPNTTVTLHMDESKTINYIFTEVTDIQDGLEFLIYGEEKSIASIAKEIIVNPQENIRGSFNLTGVFLGQTKISCKNVRTSNNIEGNLEIIVIRKERVIDKIFTASVATFVSIVYINFGCAINWGDLPKILKKPIGPTIGFVGQFVFMPLLSYGLGVLLFPGNHEMQLGMFFTGTVPGGGASNIWAVLLGGSLSLSIIMTAVSTIAAFGMMPLWIFTLGKVIFDKGNLEVPYVHITTYVIALVVPLAIGFLMQRYLKKVAHFMTKILKGFSICLILFIVIFAIVTNLYLFQLFSWQIIISGMGLPWLGYVFGYLTAMLLRQSRPDCLAIALEVGIQNTGIAIFLLRFSLPQPQADLTTVAPVSVAMLTPVPLIFLYVFIKIKERLSRTETLPSNKDIVEVNRHPKGNIHNVQSGVAGK